MSVSEKIVVIIAERDTKSPFKASGAIIWEQFTNKDREEVIEQAKRLADSNNYGNIWVCELDMNTLTHIPRKENVSLKPPAPPEPPLFTSKD